MAGLEQTTSVPEAGPIDASPPVALLVLGMHRSGTSALTRALSFLGAGLPARLLGSTTSMLQGHWEPARLIEINDALLNEAGSRWDDMRAFEAARLGPGRLQSYRADIKAAIAEDYGVSPLIVVKEPRISRLVPLYDGILAEMGYRRPLHSYAPQPPRRDRLARHPRRIYPQVFGADLAAP